MKHLLNTLAFYAHHPGWHTFKADKQTIRNIINWEKQGYLRVSIGTCQAQFTGKVFN